MADNKMGFREWIAEKLNPAQPSIAALSPYASPETIVDFEQAYREIEVVHRSVEMIINSCAEIPFKVEGQSPAKKVNASIKNVAKQLKEIEDESADDIDFEEINE